MTLRQALLSKGLITSEGQTSMLCPFHDDHSPSASLYTNEMRCWSQCSRTYRLMDFQALLGPHYPLEMAPEKVWEDDAGADKVVMFFYGEG